jgi:hypothetical protein
MVGDLAARRVGDAGATDHHGHAQAAAADGAKPIGLGRVRFPGASRERVTDGLGSLLTASLALAVSFLHTWMLESGREARIRWEPGFPQMRGHDG